MKVFSPPTEYPHCDGLFIAGGITGCPDWQSELIQKLSDTNLVIINPRRANYINGTDIAKEQISWEFRHLVKALAVSFWFPKETICPITLFELGRWSMNNKVIFVGCHPEYSRRFDVETQLNLSLPNTKVVYSINDLSTQIRDLYLRDSGEF